MIRSEDAAEVARVARAIVAELDDPESELTASAAMRNRLEGAVITLMSMSVCDVHRTRSVETVRRRSPRP